MAENPHFLTIGQLSKFTGVHIKALRYYESIGILTPAFVNPENGYRYYHHAHIPYVSIIKICANYGLPLKDFQQFILADQQVDIQTILSQVEEQIAAQERKLQADKHFLHQFQEQLQFSSQIDSDQHFHIETGNEDYLLLPFDGDMLSDDYYLALQKALSTIQELGFHFDNRVGCFYRLQDNLMQTYLACKITECQTAPTGYSLLCLKDSHTHAEHIAQEMIENKIQLLHQQHGITDFLVLETFENPYRLIQPHLEIRYFLQTQKNSPDTL